MIDENKIEYVKYRIERAKDTIKEAFIDEMERQIKAIIVK